MEQLQIILGFSDIKKQLIEKCGLQLSPRELRLWFSHQSEVVYAHNFRNHRDSIALAILEFDRWKCRVNHGHGYDLVMDIILEKTSADAVVGELIERNNLYGFFVT